MREKIPFKHIAIVIFILVVAWILMSITYPAPANGQNIDPPNSKALAIQQGIFEQFGADPAFDRYGTVSENPALVEKSLSLSEGFYVVIGEKPVSFTPALLFEQGIINPDRWHLGDWRLNASNLLNNVRPDWIVYQYYWNGLESVVFISPDGSEEAGLLVDLSRVLLPSDASSLPQPEGISVVGCSEWVAVTHSILRRPAESVKSCMDAVCTGSVATNCELSAVLNKKRLVTQMRTTPSTPSATNSDAGGCYQTIGYEVDYFVGQINLQFFQINVGKPLGGVLNSRLVCETGVTLEMVPNSQR